MQDSSKQRSVPASPGRERARITLMDALIAVFRGLFAVHNALYRLTGLDRALSHRIPHVTLEDAAYGGNWGFFTSRGEQLFYRYWPAPRTATAAVLAIHGAGAHGGHFKSIAEYNPGYLASYSIDLPGHGLSEGERGATHRTQRVLTAIADTIEFIAARHPGQPIFLIGESLGAMWAMQLAIQQSRPRALAGIVLSGPELVPRQTQPRPPGTPMWRQLLLWLKYVLYGLTISRHPIVDLTGREELVTRQPGGAESSRNDPLRNNRLSIQTIVEGYRLIRAAFRIAPRVQLPTLILQAGDDLVSDPEAARWLHDALGTRDREVHFFAEARHGLFYDPETPRVIALLGDWADRHGPALPLAA